ncbi:MAG: CoA transferase [Alphaproteobacteria bacterium]|nr:CoA transferase [Alphaproteobacteria bacterium]
MKLEGVRVLDLSLFLPGPMLTQMMSDHGAEVIKVEPRGKGEPNREIDLKRDGISVFFANTHRGKKSIELDLKSDEGKEILYQLAEKCDVFVEAFRPGVVKRLGVDYDTIKKRAPNIVYCSVSAFGQDGPYAGIPAHDLATEALAGILSVTQGQDGKPAMPGIAAADIISSMMGLSAVLMALLRRKETGEGDFIDMAMMDALVSSVPNNMGSVFGDKKPPVVKDQRPWGGNAMYNIYETADGKFVVMGAAELHFAKNVLEALGRPDLLDLCQPPPGPNQEPVREFLRETFLSRSQADWIEFFKDIECAFVPVQNMREAMDDEHVHYREMVLVDKHGHEHIGTPLKFLNEPGQLNLDLPGQGEHSEQIIRDLGYSDDQIKALRENKVI